MHRILIVLALGVCELVCDSRLVNVDAAAVSLQETSSISTTQHSGGNCSRDPQGRARLVQFALCWRPSLRRAPSGCTRDSSHP